MATDPYDVLGVAPSATDEEVKRAYRELAKKYHPDRYTDNPLADLAQDKFREVQEAYDTIMKERESGIPHGASQGGQSGPYGYGQNGGGYTQNPYGNRNYEEYQKRAQEYGGTEGGSSPCDCCMHLWCMDSLCECFGGDMIPCC